MTELITEKAKHPITVIISSLDRFFRCTKFINEFFRSFCSFCSFRSLSKERKERKEQKERKRNNGVYGNGDDGKMDNDNDKNAHLGGHRCCVYWYRKRHLKI